MDPSIAQIDATSAIAAGFASNPLAWSLAIALAAIGYLFRELRLAQEQRIAEEKANADRTISILKETIPLAAKLTECVELLDRAVDKLTERD